jgi:hypothetical protein
VELRFGLASDNWVAAKSIWRLKPRQLTASPHLRLRSLFPNVAGAGGVTSSTLAVPVACRSKRCLQALPARGVECTAGGLSFQCAP